MFDPTSLLELQTYDPRNPLTAYVYLIILAIIVRIVFIILPLRDIYKRYTKQGLKDLLFEVKRESKITGIEGFIIREMVLLLVPITAVIVLRWFVLEPLDEIVWNSTQIISASAIGVLWISLDIRDSLKTRKALQPFGARKITWKWYVYPTFADQESKIATLADPKLLHLGWWTRKKLVDLSNWEVEYIDTDTMIDPSVTEKPILITSDEGKKTIDTEALKEKAGDLAYKSLIAAKNLHSTIKEGISDISGKTVEKIDSEIQQRVDTVTKPTLMNRLFPFVYNLVMIFGPLFFIYGILPTLG